jgi:hypothetical protein
MSDGIDISGLSKAAVLAALYNNSRQQGMGFFQERGATGMTEDQAQQALDANPRLYFDYLHGRVMKISLKDDTLEPRLYDRDNGHGAAARVIAELRRQSIAA